jgi:hypothetical protein
MDKIVITDKEAVNGEVSSVIGSRVDPSRLYFGSTNPDVCEVYPSSDSLTIVGLKPGKALVSVVGPGGSCHVTRVKVVPSKARSSISIARGN